MGMHRYSTDIHTHTHTHAHIQHTHMEYAGFMRLSVARAPTEMAHEEVPPGQPTVLSAGPLLPAGGGGGRGGRGGEKGEISINYSNVLAVC
jgi:hypothetical protein